MKLLLVRHGNTFASGDKPFMVGRQQDLPLVPEGEAQAHNLAQALIRDKLIPNTIYCGALQRTRRMAEIVIQELNLSYRYEVDDRLSEIDYGDWGGLDHDTIRENYGAEELALWETRSIMPKYRGWHPTTENLLNDLRGFLADVHTQHSGDMVLAITSNGILRFISQLMSGNNRGNTNKVSTGHVCRIDYEGDRGQIVYWNRDPRENLQ